MRNDSRRSVQKQKELVLQIEQIGIKEYENVTRQET